MFNKILIANRGEIAVRIIRACREMGIRTVAVYSEADRDALHTQLADEAVCIGKAQSSDSYLNMERILSATIATKAEAIHPGFGFLSENSRFVEMCEKCNVAFIGPSAEVISRMGNKSEAKNTMRKAKVPVVPGTKEPVYTVEQALEAVKEIGFPVMIKASAGGGGKGMRVAGNEQEFAKLFETAQQESVHSFSDNTMYLERFVENPRHVEVQILADKYGNVVHLGERDCSVQRRHQKMIEESPCIAISDDLRKKMGETAVRAAKAAGYESAGTIEFLLDQSGEFYFMEMNTRIQVEHGVTEMVTGTDLIIEQIRVAMGMELSFTQEDVEINGHAIECRINAEIPEKNFMPSPGVIKHLHLPAGNGVRVDTAIYTGYCIPSEYDSMIAKVIVHAPDRDAALQKMRSALDEMVILGTLGILCGIYFLVRNVLWISMSEDIQNLGLLHTIGATERQITKIYRKQMRLLMLKGSVLGSLISVLILVLLIPEILGFHFYQEMGGNTILSFFRPWILLISVIFVNGILWIASEGVIRKITKLSCIESAAYDENIGGRKIKHSGKLVLKRAETGEMFYIAWGKYNTS